MRPILAGPADADNFRVEVGRYGDRWYTDPLPDCSIAPASEAVWPSISTCKKASGADWSFVSLRRVAAALEIRPDRFDGLDREERLQTMQAINKSGLRNAAERGTAVHHFAEDMLHGREPVVMPGDPGLDYLPALQEFFAAYSPRLLATEFVAIHRDLNGVGYGGTSDALVEIDGKRYLTDWKSRGEDSKHGAYPEEAAQIAGYGRAQYWIVDKGMGAIRGRVPRLDGGLIISVKPSGCRVYPVDLDKAFVHWQSLHAWWVARRDERDSIGRQWAVKKSSRSAA